MKVFYVDNVASHYRKAIFLLMDKTYDITYLFGQSLGDIKQMDTSLLKGKVEKTKTRKVWKEWYWQPGVVCKAFQSFDRYLLIGDPWALSTWLICIIMRIMGKSDRVFFWGHGWYGKETRLRSFVKKQFYGLASGGIFLYGNYARRLMIEEEFDPKKLFVIHNSLDYENQIVLRKKLTPNKIYWDHFTNNYKNLIFVGRLTKVKKLDILLSALKSCSAHGHIYNLTFVGNGEKKEELQLLTKQLSLDNQVWFYGACYDENVLGELIFNADLCVAPGNVGLTAMHSMVFGTPVITHNNFPYQMPEFESIHEGATGAFFKQDDVESLRDTIISWIEGNKDREVIRRACYQEIDEQWTPEYHMEILKNNMC